MTQSRLTLLKSVQALTEIQEFLLFIKGDGEWRCLHPRTSRSRPVLTS